jgi:hypothetical protein
MTICIVNAGDEVIRGLILALSNLDGMSRESICSQVLRYRLGAGLGMLRASTCLLCSLQSAAVSIYGTRLMRVAHLAFIEVT